MSITIDSVGNNVDKQTKWFDDIIAALRGKELQLNTKTASHSSEKLFTTLIHGTRLEGMQLAWESLKKDSAVMILMDYMDNLAKEQKLPKTLAFDITSSKFLVWAEINDDDESHEDYLLLLEARLNAKFQDIGMQISSTIVESSDNLEIPSHYKVVTTED